MIHVTKTFLPPFEEYSAILKRAWDKSWITNNGELVLELEAKLRDYLDVKNLWFTSNGTVVLQMALKALKITKEVITTPFSYVATTNVILWEGCTPVFVDIDPKTLCIDPSKIEEAITKDTQAILATHVYGIPCDVEAIDLIAKKHNLKVIYDGAHAFGVMYKGKSLLSYGDVSTCSFHATKIFHTVEGGCITCPDPNLSHQFMLMRQFGHIGDDYFVQGINGKNSELHAAMGLSVLPMIEHVIELRAKIVNLYMTAFRNHNVSSPISFLPLDTTWNFSYCPVIFSDEKVLEGIKNMLANENIHTRRYFYPSLNSLDYFEGHIKCPISEDISKRILALPLCHDLDPEIQDKIIDMIRQKIS